MAITLKPQPHSRSSAVFAISPLVDADRIGRSVAAALAPEIPDMQSFTWSARAAET
jgi:hypothetical protein